MVFAFQHLSTGKVDLSQVYSNHGPKNNLEARSVVIKFCKHLFKDAFKLNISYVSCSSRPPSICLNKSPRDKFCPRPRGHFLYKSCVENTPRHSA